MKKNLLSGLLAGVMAVSLVACGNSESKTSNRREQRHIRCRNGWKFLLH